MRRRTLQRLQVRRKGGYERLVGRERQVGHRAEDQQRQRDEEHEAQQEVAMRTLGNAGALDQHAEAKVRKDRQKLDQDVLHG